MPEKQDIEYKSNWHDDYLKTICAFANSNGGKLFIGKNDKGKTIGIENYKKLMDELPNKIRNLLGLYLEVNLQKEEEKYFIEIIAEPQTVAISLRGRFYIRRGSITTELTGNALNEFLLKKSGRTWDDVIENRASLEDIDEKEVERFVRIAEKTNRLPDVEGLSLEEMLEKLRLTENNKLKRAAILLFGKDPNKFYPNIKIKIGRFGKSDDDLLYDEVEEGNLFYLLRNVILQLNRKFFKNPIEFEGLQRVVKGEYPVAALREILLNALIHKEYSSSSAIQIKVYDNKINIWNQGVLPPQLNSELLKINHPSVPRNPFIADVFYKSGHIDNWGRGTLKIYNSCKEAELPEPEIIEAFDGISASLFISDKSTKFTVENRSEKNLAKLGLNKRQILAFQYLKENGKITNKEYRQLTSISDEMARIDLLELIQKELIISKGKGRGVYYILK